MLRLAQPNEQVRPLGQRSSELDRSIEGAPVVARSLRGRQLGERFVTGERRPMDRFGRHSGQRAVLGQLHDHLGARFARPLGKRPHRAFVELGPGRNADLAVERVGNERVGEAKGPAGGRQVDQETSGH